MQYVNMVGYSQEKAVVGLARPADGGKAAVCPWLVHTAIPLLACEV